MDDQRHAGIDARGHVLEDVRLGVDEQAEPVAAHAGVFAGRVLAEPCARNTSFSARAMSAAVTPSRTTAMPASIDREPERVRLLLLGVRLADDQRAADLRVVAIDARRELGGDHVAALELLARRRRHAAHFRPTDADDLKVVIDAVGAEERLDLGDQFVVGAADPRRLPGTPRSRRPRAWRRARMAAISESSFCINSRSRNAVWSARLQILGARREPARASAARAPTPMR